jgi:hypothetical protein
MPPRKVVPISEDEHFADYAELQQSPERPDFRLNLAAVGVALITIALWGLIWMFVHWLRSSM